MNLFQFGELFFSESPRYHWWTKPSPCCYGTYHMSHHLQFLMTTSWQLDSNRSGEFFVSFLNSVAMKFYKHLQIHLLTNLYDFSQNPRTPWFFWSTWQTCWPCRSVMDHPPCWPQSRQLPVMACHRNMDNSGWVVQCGKWCFGTHLRIPHGKDLILGMVGFPFDNYRDTVRHIHICIYDRFMFTFISKKRNHCKGNKYN